MIELKTSNFDAEISGKTPVLVDFWASWCGPCRALAPTLQKLDAELAGAVKICKVNVDDEPELAERYGIMTIPTLLLFANGELKKKTVGVQSLDFLKDWINNG